MLWMLLFPVQSLNPTDVVQQRKEEHVTKNGLPSKRRSYYSVNGRW